MGYWSNSSMDGDSVDDLAQTAIQIPEKMNRVLQVANLRVEKGDEPKHFFVGVLLKLVEAGLKPGLVWLKKGRKYAEEERDEYLDALQIVSVWREPKERFKELNKEVVALGGKARKLGPTISVKEE